MNKWKDERENTRKKISLKILRTEIEFCLTCIEKQNYGWLKDVLLQILSRIERYNLK